MTIGTVKGIPSVPLKRHVNDTPSDESASEYREDEGSPPFELQSNDEVISVSAMSKQQLSSSNESHSQSSVLEKKPRGSRTPQQVVDDRNARRRFRRKMLKYAVPVSDNLNRNIELANSASLRQMIEHSQQVAKIRETVIDYENVMSSKDTEEAMQALSTLDAYLIKCRGQVRSSSTKGRGLTSTTTR